MTNWASLQDIPPVADYRIVNEATDAKDPYVLERLSRHEDPNVRARVAENGRTPMDVLERLAGENGPHADYIKMYLIRNPVVPYRLLSKMIKVESPELRKRIFYKLLDGYKQAKVDLTGEEVHSLLKELAPDMNELEFIELLETIHEIRDAEKRNRI